MISEKKVKRREKAESRWMRMQTFDMYYRVQGHYLGGMDEVGRGPLAGPVLAACVIIPDGMDIIGVNDSKKLSEKKREQLFSELYEGAISVGFGLVDHQTIDEINILNATEKAYIEAYHAMERKPDLLLVDGNRAIPLPIEQMPVIRGDTLSYSIAVASILAKVTRDRLMIAYDAQYPLYGFAQNKGYGTQQHIVALQKYGPCPIHRRSFIRRIMDAR